MADIKKTCAFTGYRTAKLESSLREAGFDMAFLQNKIRSLILSKIKEDYTVFLCGMALGADTIFAQEVLAVRSMFPLVELHAVIPCLHQEKKWNENDKEIYYKILEDADVVLYISDSYYDGCMQKRNRYLIDNSEALIAVYDGKSGGTHYTVKYARTLGRQITIFNPTEHLQITLLD